MMSSIQVHLTKFRKLRLKDVNLLDMLIQKTVEIALEKEIIKRQRYYCGCYTYESTITIRNHQKKF